jgi:hypothetical protein
LLDSMVVLVSGFWGNPILFSLMAILIYIIWVSLSSHAYQNFFFKKILLVLAILSGVRWYFIVVLICISLTISDTEHFSYILWPFVYLPWEMYIQVICPFFRQTICPPPLLLLLSFLYILDTNPLSNE